MDERGRRPRSGRYTKRESVSHSLRYEVSKWSLKDFEVIGSYHKLLDEVYNVLCQRAWMHLK